MKKVKYILQVKDSDFTKESDSFNELVDYAIDNNLFTQEDKITTIFNSLIDNEPNWVRQPGIRQIYNWDFEKVVFVKEIMEE